MPGSVAVLAGLKDGERVILEGTQRVRDGALVAEAEPERDEATAPAATAAAPAGGARKANP